MSVEPGDHYATLGLPPTASSAEISAAYRQRRRNPGATPLERIEKAYTVLGDAAKRARYDRLRGERLAAAATGAPVRAAAAAPARAARPAAPSRASAAATPAAEAPSLRTRLAACISAQRGAFRGLAGMWNGALLALAAVYAAIQPLPWAQGDGGATWSAWDGAHAGAYLTPVALLAAPLEIALFPRRTWWIARLLSAALVVIGGSTAVDVAHDPVAASQFLGFAGGARGVTLTGVPYLDATVALLFGLTLLLRTATITFPRVRREIAEQQR